MQKVGVLVVSYGARAAAVIDALKRSEEYDVRVYVADKQRNPFNAERAEAHAVIPDLSVDTILKFAERHKDALDFGIVCPEGPIIEGVRDAIEERLKIPMICPKKEFALEGSKARQRLLLAKVAPEANPEFRIFRRSEFKSVAEVKEALWRFLDEIGDDVAVKPDRPAAGKGVGVFGEHFHNREQLFEHFLSIFETSDVVVEKKLEGEESSFQAFCDGRRLEPLPETRDYKRAFDGDFGPNTGGMGSYKDAGDLLPFMEPSDREKELALVEKIFKALQGDGRNEGLIGMPFYVAFMHTADGPKILEINSRPGDPEIQNILPVMRSDFVELCFRMLEGSLQKVECERRATVVTYAAPLTYGGYRTKYTGDSKVDLSGAYKLKEKYGDDIRIYPGAMELRDDGCTYALRSRAVCVVGIADDLRAAREISLDGIRNIDGPLWNRWDVAAEWHVEKSVEKMRRLRAAASTSTSASDAAGSAARRR